MVPLAYVFTILSIFSALALADDVKPSQPESVEEKWRSYGWGSGWNGNRYAGSYFGNLGWYGTGFNCGSSYSWLSLYPSIGACAVMPYTGYRAWFKEVNNSPAARRALTLDAERMYRRDASPVGCKNQQGQLEYFVPADCHHAVNSLVSKKTSSASCNSCAIKLVSPTGLLAATGFPADELHQMTDKVLQSCSSGVTPVASHARRSPEDGANSADSKRQFALIFLKGDGSKCDA